MWCLWWKVLQRIMIVMTWLLLPVLLLSLRERQRMLGVRCLGWMRVKVLGLHLLPRPPMIWRRRQHPQIVMELMRLVRRGLWHQLRL